MNTVAALAAAVLVIGGLSPVADKSAPEGGAISVVHTVAALLEEPSVHVLDETEAVEGLTAAGFDVESVDVDDALVSVDLDSHLGDGSAVDTSLSVDLTDGAGTATVVSDSLPAEKTVLAIAIHELTDDFVDVTVTDTSTGQSQRVNSSGQGAAVPLVLGIPLVISALEALITASAAVIVAGVTYVAVANAVEALNKRGSSYQHFVAVRLNGRPLMIGSGISFGTAVARVSSRSDVWSRSQNGAMSVCKSASAGRTPIGPEIDKNGSHKVHHFHTAPKNGAHCFFGGPR